MTRSDEGATRCPIVIKRPLCDNILARILLLRPLPLLLSQISSNLSLFLVKLSRVSAMYGRATYLNNLIAKKKLKSMPNIYVTTSQMYAFIRNFRSTVDICTCYSHTSLCPSVETFFYVPFKESFKRGPNAILVFEFVFKNCWKFDVPENIFKKCML